MKTSTFSNALVAVVGAYAEGVAEQAQAIEQLTAALRSTAAPNPALKALIDAVDAVITERREGVRLVNAIDQLAAAREALR